MGWFRDFKQGVSKGFKTVFSLKGIKKIGENIKEGQEIIREGKLGEPLKEFISVAETVAGFTPLKYATRAIEAYGDFATGDIVRGVTDVAGLTALLDEIRKLTRGEIPSTGGATIQLPTNPQDFNTLMTKLGLHTQEEDEYEDEYEVDREDRTDYFGANY